MTDQERISRETLLKRAAAVAGAVYVAPVLTSAAAAESPESCHRTPCRDDIDCPSRCACNVRVGYCRPRKVCNGQPCRTSRQCRKKGGAGCRCVDGKCTPPAEEGGARLTL